MKPEKLKDEYQRILADSEQYLTFIHNYREQLVSMDMKMKDIQSKVLDEKKNVGDRIQTQRRPLLQYKQISIMEDRVKQATTKFNKLLSRNQVLRDEIDHLRLQRNNFTKIYLQLKRELEHQNNTMEDLVEKSVLAYDQRSEALARMLAVREHSKKDTSLCHTEMTDLKRVIDHEIKLRSFMVKKFQDALHMGKDDEAKKKKLEQVQRERMGGESLETYQAVHRLIVEVARENDLRQIGKAFVENEGKSFAYFNFINELNNKSTMLNDRINKLKNDILHIELDNKQCVELWCGQVKQLEGELKQKCELTNSLEGQHMGVLKFLDEYKGAIGNLFAKMKCDPSPITVKLGCSAEVTNDNVVQFIGILEEQMHELLMVLALCSFTHAEKMEVLPLNPLLASCDLLPGVTHSTIEAPCSSAMDDTSTDSLLGLGSEVLLDFQSLRERVLSCVMRTEQGKSPRAPSAQLRGKKKMTGFNPKSA
ncbi:coiled-coil domain-containing protein 63-like [Hypomesus transpacificus]|uniref:coiled-coil domain-containing protein 63-like n=1 Tax=Hypomesus transpacificus TaxID=137520 RepID=UPI001F077406|nr:coiled-coil domain-containing protein 63-like [Hypomesus transpacificus]